MQRRGPPEAVSVRCLGGQPLGTAWTGVLTYRAVGADVTFVASIRARADLDACHPPARDEKHPRLYTGALIPPTKLGTHRVFSHGSGSKLLSPVQ